MDLDPLREATERVSTDLFDFLADLEQETAQLVICAMALAESAGFDVFCAVTDEYERCTAPLLAEEGT